MSELRSKVIQLYKHLQYLGREYPGVNGPQKFRQQVKDAFLKNKDEKDPKKVMALLAQGRYAAKELIKLHEFKANVSEKEEVHLRRHVRSNIQ